MSVEATGVDHILPRGMGTRINITGKNDDLKTATADECEGATV